MIIDATVVGRARARRRRRARGGGDGIDDDVGIDVARDTTGRIDARAGDGDAARVDVVQRRVVQRDERRGGERRRRRVSSGGDRCERDRRAARGSVGGVETRAVVGAGDGSERWVGARGGDERTREGAIRRGGGRDETDDVRVDVDVG